MPSSLSSRSSRTAVAIAAWAAEPPDRSIGTCPTPEQKVFFSRPTSPGCVQYSRFARNVMRRGTSSGRKNESTTARWLLARMAPPRSGTFSTPSIVGRQSRRSHGPRSTNFDHQYSTWACPLRLDCASLRTLLTHRQRARRSERTPRLQLLLFVDLPCQDGRHGGGGPPAASATGLHCAGRGHE